MIALYRMAAALAAVLAGFGALCALLAALILSADALLMLWGVAGLRRDWSELSLLLALAALCLALPHGFTAGSHACVNGVGEKFSWRGQQRLKALAALLGLLLMLVLLRFGWQGMRAAGEGIFVPLAWYWYPALFGAAYAALLCLLLIWRHLRALRHGHDACETESV